MKTLAEIRDELADERFDSSDLGDGSSCHYGFLVGFDHGAKAVMEQAQKLVEALKFYERPIGLSSNTNDYLNGHKVAEGAIKEWQEFVQGVKK